MQQNATNNSNKIKNFKNLKKNNKNNKKNLKIQSNLINPKNEKIYINNICISWRWQLIYFI